jgi:hypothetical protein
MAEKESQPPLSSPPTAWDSLVSDPQTKFESTLLPETPPLTLNELKASYRSLRIEIAEDLKEETFENDKVTFFEILVTGVYKREPILLKADETSLKAFHSKVHGAI